MQPGVRAEHLGSGRRGGGVEEVRTARCGGAQAGRLSADSVKTSLGHRGLEPKPFC